MLNTLEQEVDTATAATSDPHPASTVCHTALEESFLFLSFFMRSLYVNCVNFKLSKTIIFCSDALWVGSYCAVMSNG